MGEDIRLPFDLPAVVRKKVSAAFDGGRITSGGGSAPHCRACVLPLQGRRSFQSRSA